MGIERRWQDNLNAQALRAYEAQRTRYVEAANKIRNPGTEEVPVPELAEELGLKEQTVRRYLLLNGDVRASVNPAGWDGFMRDRQERRERHSVERRRILDAQHAKRDEADSPD